MYMLKTLQKPKLRVVLQSVQRLYSMIFIFFFQILFVIVCVDEWTNTISNSVINFTVINDKGEAFLVDSIDNALERNTAKRLSDLTHSVISTLKVNGVNITGLITDNCNTMKALKSELCLISSEYRSIIKVGCCCHILAIMLKRISNIDYIHFALDIVY